MSPAFLKQIPGVRRVRNALRRLLRPGHFYSPYPDTQYVERHKARIFDRQIASVPGIDTRAEDQLALVARFAAYYGELPFKDEASAALRYHFRNPEFSYADALILYSMLRHFRPRRVIEIGSGFSSAAMLDTDELFLSGKTTFTFVEPYPKRLYSVLRGEDRQRHRIIVDAVQNVPLDRFAQLGAGDFLFVDSSHVAKTGSDVVHLFGSVLPMLAKGVLVHFHDVFWPFEYPEEWIRDGRAWNEAYVLKAFLQFNSAFRIVLFNSYLGIHHRAVVERHLPLFLQNTGGSLWIEKTS